MKTPQSVAVLFSDIEGFSKLQHDEVNTFVNGVLKSLGAIIEVHRNKLIDTNTWGDAIFATSFDIQEIARMGLEIRDFFLHPGAYTDLIKEKLRIRIALDFVDAEIGPNYIIPGLKKGCHGSELTRAARLEPVTPSNAVFVTKAFRDHLQGRPLADQFQLVEFPHELHLPKGFGPTKVFSLHWRNEAPGVRYDNKLRELDAVGPIIINSWFVRDEPRHQEIMARFNQCQDGDEVSFICITGRSLIFPHLYGGEGLIEKSLVAGALKRGVKVKGIVLDTECSEARFRSMIESPNKLDPEDRLLQRDAQIVKSLVSDPLWRELKDKVPSGLILKKSNIGLSFSLIIFDDQAAVIEPYHFGKLPEREGQPHMCKFSQFTIFKTRDEEYRMLRKHFDNLWENSAYLWPEIHGPRASRIQSLLKPANLQTELTRRIDGDQDGGRPIHIEHLVSNTLRIGQRLRVAFEEIGPPLKVSCRLREAKPKQDLCQFVSQARTSRSDFILLQIQGIEGEERLLEPFFKVREEPNAELKGRLVVYIHRPEELILRIAAEQEIALKKQNPKNECPYFIAKELLQNHLRKADAVVLPGSCFVGEYQEMLPQVPVVSIPLGFVEPGVHVDLSARLDGSGVAFIGSDTTWGEMRHLDDVVRLTQAIHFIDSNLKTTGYALGTFDDRCNLSRYRGNPDIVFVSNQEIEAAYSQKAFSTESEFREWLHQRASGRLIVRARAEHDRMMPERIPPTMEPLFGWESGIVDFNVQMYYEVLDHKRDPERQGQPKVEYSGTLHKGAAHVLFVVFESPAMDDVERDEGLCMIHVPMSKRNPHFHEAAAKIVRLIRNPEERREMLDHNRQSTKILGMNEVAFAFFTLMRQLSET
jgi:class 3 adenylate cyclase